MSNNPGAMRLGNEIARLGSVTATTDEEQRDARRIVEASAHDGEDAALLLDALGLETPRRN